MRLLLLNDAAFVHALLYQILRHDVCFGVRLIRALRAGDDDLRLRMIVQVGKRPVSYTHLVNSAPEYYQSLEKWAVNVLEDNPEIRTYVERALDTIQSYVENWVKTSFLSDVQKILATLTTSVMAVVKSITNFIIGLVASIYILWSKDTFQAQAKKMVVAAFKPSAANHLLDLGRNINRIFSGFIIGKIIDSAIIGVLCYICMSLMKMPYTALIATIVGVTNVIPVFGPFIGAVPSALIILLVEPLQAFYFIIFIIVLQQVDGNVMAPRFSAIPSVFRASGCSFRSPLRRAFSASRGCSSACRCSRSSI